MIFIVSGLPETLKASQIMTRQETIARPFGRVKIHSLPTEHCAKSRKQKSPTATNGKESFEESLKFHKTLGRKTVEIVKTG
jgi:hypothetical protein